MTPKSALAMARSLVDSLSKRVVSTLLAIPPGEVIHTFILSSMCGALGIYAPAELGPLGRAIDVSVTLTPGHPAVAYGVGSEYVGGDSSDQCQVYSTPSPLGWGNWAVKNNSAVTFQLSYAIDIA